MLFLANDSLAESHRASRLQTSRSTPNVLEASTQEPSGSVDVNQSSRGAVNYRSLDKYLGNGTPWSESEAAFDTASDNGSVCERPGSPEKKVNVNNRFSDLFQLTLLVATIERLVPNFISKNNESTVALSMQGLL